MVTDLTISWHDARVFFRGAYLTRVSDRSKDPESPYDSVAVAPDDGGDPKVVDRWLFRAALLALEIHWGGSSGPLQQSFTDTSAGRMEGNFFSPGIMRVGARWCAGRQRLTLHHTPLWPPLAREQEPAKNRRREPSPGRDEHLRHGQRA